MRLMPVATLFVTTMLAAPLAATSMDIPSGRYEVDPAHVSVTWKIGHLGLSNYTARFVNPASTVMLDAADVAKSKLDVTIKTRSVRTDFPFADKIDFDKESAPILSSSVAPLTRKSRSSRLRSASARAIRRRSPAI